MDRKQREQEDIFYRMNDAGTFLQKKTPIPCCASVVPETGGYRPSEYNDVCSTVLYDADYEERHR
ncbi:MAG: hypothetical protein IJ191_05350 [Treponema sp.]|nr:hypothetical protein [Treponema sp.]